MTNPLLPSPLPVTIAAAIAGCSPAVFVRHVLPLIETENGRVVTRSLERNLDHFISAEQYLAADRKQDGIRQKARSRGRRRAA
jgi:hypothetical protein